MGNELTAKYQRELERLDAEYAHYEQQWTKVPRFALVGLSVPIAWFVWGWGAGVVALLVSAALVGTRAYLIAMRKGEIRWNRERLVSDMEEVESAASTDHPAPSQMRHA